MGQKNLDLSTLCSSASHFNVSGGYILWLLSIGIFGTSPTNKQALKDIISENQK
jgi:hypothetical protein